MINLGDAVLFFKGDLTNFNSAIGSATKGVQDGMGNILNATHQTGLAFAALGGAIVAPMGLAVKAASDFGGAMAEINTLGVKQLDEIEAGIKDVATTFGTDLVETAKGAYQAISATGFDGAEAVGLLESATKAAVAGVASVSEAVELGTGVMNAFGMEASEINTIYDEAFIAVKNGVTTFGELSASVGKVAPVMAAAGLQSDEMFASVTALTKAGIGTAEAVTGMKAAMTNIIKPASDASDAAEEMGLDFSVGALQAQGLEGFLQAVATATGGNVEQMARLFPSVEALNAVLALTGSQAGSLSGTLEEMRGKTYGVDEAYAAFAARDPGLAFRQLKSEMQVLAVEVGAALLPALKGIVDWVTPIVHGIVEWTKEHPKLTQGIVMTGAALGTLSLGLGGVGLAVRPLVMTFTTLRAVTGFLSGAGGFAKLATAATTASGAFNGIGIAGAALAAAPWILGIGAIAIALTAIGISAWKTKEAFDELEKSNERLAVAEKKYHASLKARGIILDENAMKEMTHAEQRAYIIEQEKKQLDSVLAKHIEVNTGKAASDLQLAQGRNLALNEHLGAEEAAAVASMGLARDALMALMQADEQETQAILVGLGIRTQAEEEAAEAAVATHAWAAEASNQATYDAENFRDSVLTLFRNKRLSADEVVMIAQMEQERGRIIEIANMGEAETNQYLGELNKRHDLWERATADNRSLSEALAFVQKELDGQTASSAEAAAQRRQEADGSVADTFAVTAGVMAENFANAMRDREAAHATSADNMVRKEDQATSMIGGMWEGLWNTVKGWFGLGGGAMEPGEAQSFAMGGTVAGAGGLVLIQAGEEGPEEAEFPSGEKGILGAGGAGMFSVPPGTEIKTADETEEEYGDFVGSFADGGIVPSAKQRRQLKASRKKAAKTLEKAVRAGMIDPESFTSAWWDIATGVIPTTGLFGDPNNDNYIVGEQGTSFNRGGDMEWRVSNADKGIVLKSVAGELELKNVPRFARGGVVQAQAAQPGTGGQNITNNFSFPNLTIREEADIEKISREIARTIPAALAGTL